MFIVYIIAALMLSARSEHLFDEAASNAAARRNWAAYRIFNLTEQFHFAPIKQLCDRCGLPGDLNVSTFSVSSSVEYPSEDGVSMSANADPKNSSSPLRRTQSKKTTAMSEARVGFVARDDSGDLYLAFAGDDPNSLPIDLFTLTDYPAPPACQDLKIERLKVYKPGYDAWKAVRGEVVRLLMEFMKTEESSQKNQQTLPHLAISGHSFGSGLADIAALDLAAASADSTNPLFGKFNLAPTHTFGDGHMGNANFVSCFNTTVVRNHGYFRVVHGRDPVPQSEGIVKSEWHLTSPEVFYDGPGENLTSWTTQNFTLCTGEADPKCSAKYVGEYVVPAGPAFKRYFEDFHVWYGGLSLCDIFELGPHAVINGCHSKSPR